jgi:hypothetical protein
MPITIPDDEVFFGSDIESICKNHLFQVDHDVRNIRKHQQ